MTHTISKNMAAIFLVGALLITHKTYTSQANPSDTCQINKSSKMSTDDLWRTFITRMHMQKQYLHEETVGYYSPVTGYIFRLECTSYDKNNHRAQGLFAHGIYPEDEYYKTMQRTASHDSFWHSSNYEELSKEQLLKKARSLQLSAAALNSFETLLDVLEVNLEIFNQSIIYPNNLKEWRAKREELRKRKFEEKQDA